MIAFRVILFAIVAASGSGQDLFLSPSPDSLKAPNPFANDTNDEGRHQCVPDGGHCGPHPKKECCNGFRCYQDGHPNHWVCDDHGKRSGLPALASQDLFLPPSPDSLKAPKPFANDTNDEGRHKCVPDGGHCGPHPKKECCNGFRCYQDGHPNHWVCDDHGKRSGLPALASQDLFLSPSPNSLKAPKPFANDTNEEGRFANDTNDVGPDKCIPDDGKCGPHKWCKIGDQCNCCKGFACYPDGHPNHWVCDDHSKRSGLPALASSYF